jgi:nucleoside-diphosphate-sugar epimerase
MHIFLTGATGAIGSSFIPQAIEHGHTVTGTTRSSAKAARLVELGATPVVVDGLDRDGMIAAITEAQPDAVLHEMTALSGLADARHPEKTFAMTNRLRTEGTDHLLAGAGAAGVERVIVQSFGGWALADTNERVVSEDTPLDPDPPKKLRSGHEAMRYAERAALEFGGTALRYGGFYGPGTGMAPGAEQWELVRARKFPVVGNGAGVWSFIHIDDAASATLAALEQDARGLFHVTDDEPAAVRDWLPALAQAIGAPEPRHVPRWVARLIGEHIAVMMTDTKGTSNAKIKAQLGWEPAWPTWREGFSALGGRRAAATPARR